MHVPSDDGTGWRDWITPKLQTEFNLIVEDPAKKTVNGGLCEVKDDKKKFKEMAKREDWEQLKEGFYPIVRKDLRCVDKADFIIAVYDPTIASFGTIHEIIEAAHQKKPILVRYDREQLDHFNPWLTCLVKPQWLFPTWEKMFEYLSEIDSGVIETSHWGLE